MDAPSLLFSPNSNWYAVIRMDPVAMVSGLDDPEAVAAARAISTKSYLVYITEEPELPFPNKAWYSYTVSVIGPSLREEDDGKAITADMCIPIYPNEAHPTGRQPIHPRKPFPYKNCYHWLRMEMDVRVLARPEQFDANQAISLPSSDRIEMDLMWSDDVKRIVETKARRAAATLQEPLPPPTDALHPDTGAEGGRCSAEHEHTSLHRHAVAPSGSHSLHGSCGSQSVSGEESDVDSLEDIMRLNIFGGPDKDLALLPLCELWVELASTLREEDIPHPAGLFRERDEIVRIIQDARVRAYAALNAAAPSSGHELSPNNADMSARDGDVPGRRSRRFRLRKVLRKTHAVWKTWAVVAVARLRLPYIPVWP